MAHADWEAVVRSGIGLRPIPLIRITLEAPKGGADTVFVFGPAKGHDTNKVAKRLGISIHPFIHMPIGGASVKIDPSQFNTDRGVMRVTFKDDERDVEALDGALVYATSGSSFWRTIFVAFENQIYGAKFEVFSFFDHPNLDALSKAEPFFVGRIEDFSVNKNLSVTITARDPLTLKDVSVPQPASKDNELTSAIGSTAQLLPVTDQDEFIGPGSLPSANWMPTAVKINDEIIVIRSKSGSTNLRVGRNYLGRSEAFQNWTATSATATDSAIDGPWGGEIVNGTEVEMNAATDKLTRASVQNADGDTFHFSLWVREHPDYPGEDIRLQIHNSVTFLNTTITLTDKWERVKVNGVLGAIANPVTCEILGKTGLASTMKFYVAMAQCDREASFRPYVYTTTDATAGDDAGRGQFGTTAASHSSGDQVIPVQVYAHQSDSTKGLHPVAIARSLLNFGLIDDADIDEDAFQREQDFEAGATFRRTILDPRKAKQLLAEIRRDSLLDLWGGEDGLVTARLSYRPKLPGQTYFELKESTNILRQSGIGWDANKDTRVTRIFVYYDLKVSSDGVPEKGTAPEDFNEVRVRVDPDAEGVDDRAMRSEFVFSQWIYRDTEAANKASRTIGRFRLGARSASLSAAYSARADFKVGDVVLVESPILVKRIGSSVVEDDQSLWQARQITDPFTADRLEIDLLEANQARLAFINYNSATDYDSDEGLTVPSVGGFYWDRAYIADNNNFLGADNDPAYVII